MRVRAALSTVALVGLLAAGCGGDDTDGTREAPVDGTFTTSADEAVPTFLDIATLERGSDVFIPPTIRLTGAQ